jgi:hypothetical protein
MRVLKGGSQTLYVWRNLQLIRGRIVLFISLLVFAFLLFALNVFPYASMGLIMVPIAYVLGVYSYSSFRTWQGGSLGEKLVTKSLSGLDDSYVLLNGLVVPPNRGDTDHIVIGPNGFFVIESKNYNGRISCDGDEWEKRKMIRGELQSLKIGSPSNQVKRNAKVLKDFILSHQEDVFLGAAPHIWVSGILVFTNPDAELELNRPTVDVVELDELCDHIRAVKTESPLSAENIAAAAKALIRYAL